MEQYHLRFTNSDIDDSQLQKEMFVKLAGPLLGNCKPFLKKVLDRLGKRYVLSENARHFTKGKVIAKFLNRKPNFPFHNYL